MAGNNKLYHTPGASDSTLKNEQWGIGPRIGVIYSVRPDLVVRSGFGIYYDRGEFFTEFSPSAGNGFNARPFGAPLPPPFVPACLCNLLPAIQSSNHPLVLQQLQRSDDTNPADFIKNLSNMGALINGAAPYLFGAYGLNNKLPYHGELDAFDVQWQARPDIAISHGLYWESPLSTPDDSSAI